MPLLTSSTVLMLLQPARAAAANSESPMPNFACLLMLAPRCSKARRQAARDVPLELAAQLPHLTPARHALRRGVWPRWVVFDAAGRQNGGFFADFTWPGFLLTSL